MLKNAVIFGAGGTASLVFHRVKSKYNIIAFADNNKDKQGAQFLGLPVIAPHDLKTLHCDYIIIGTDMRDSVIEQVTGELDLPREILIDEELKLICYRARRIALKNAAMLVGNQEGAVAEAGVFQGEFAREINAAFPERTLYLFDTFEGFDLRDTLSENASTGALPGEFDINTGPPLVLNKMPHPEKCVIKKGYFPETAEGIYDNFLFVSLDMDLYKPTLEGLKFFFPKLCPSGCIFIHDYFSERFSGVKQAVDEFLQTTSVNISPLGDDCSICITRGSVL